MLWTLEELKILRQQYLRGIPSNRISLLLPNHTQKSIDNKISELDLRRKYEQLTDGKELGHLDIESSQLNAAFGMILTYAIKRHGKNEIIGDTLTEKDFRQKDKLQTDKRLVNSLADSMEGFDGFTTYFGTYFDIPFIRSRCLRHGRNFLEYGSKFHLDIWKIVKRSMKLHSHRLEAVAQHLGVNSKTKLEPDVWIRGTMGDMDAIKIIYEHNRQDVIMLERVYEIMKRYNSGARVSV